MRWIPFAVLAYIMLGLQIGLGGVGQFGGGAVNFVLIAASFIAINAQRNVAMPACFGLGLLQDLVGTGPIGTYALAYSLIALLVAGTDRALSVEHPFTHGVVTLMGGVITAIVVWLVGWRQHLQTPITPYLLSAVYSAVLALPILWLLTRLRRTFRFRTSVGR